MYHSYAQVRLGEQLTFTVCFKSGSLQKYAYLVI